MIPATMTDRERMSARLKTAYVTAMTSQHEGARVEIHAGSEVVEFLKSTTIRVPIRCNRLWGFPLIENDDPDHLSIHTVTVIHP